MASLALRRAKQRSLRRNVVFGARPATARWRRDAGLFVFVDVVGQGDADLTIAPLILARGVSPADFRPGIIYRDDAGRVRSTAPRRPSSNSIR